jgi:zinc transport system substrate-binding protein
MIMNNIGKNIRFALFLLISLLLQCGNNQKDTTANDKLSAFTGIVPIAYFVERIGGDYIDVRTLMPSGQDPHLYQPTPRQIVALEKTQLLFQTGLPFEKRVFQKVKTDHKSIAIINTAEGIKLRQIKKYDHHHDDKHSEKVMGEEENGDPHIWLGVPQIRIIVANITKALTEADPIHAENYKINSADLLKEIDAVHSKISQVLLPFKGRTIFVFHPAFGYFAGAYGLREEPVEIMGKSPSPKQLSELISRAKEENVKVIFVQPEFDTKSALVVADAIEGAVIPLNPLEKNVLKNLEEIAQKIEEALKR